MLQSCKSKAVYIISIVYLPCIVNQGWLKICRSVGRFIGTRFSNELIKFLPSVEMKLINRLMCKKKPLKYTKCSRTSQSRFLNMQYDYKLITVLITNVDYVETICVEFEFGVDQFIKAKGFGFGK